MKNYIAILGLLIFSFGKVTAHSARYDNVNTKQWYLQKQHAVIDATFYFSRNDSAFFEKADGAVIGLPIADLTSSDQKFVKTKIVEIERINQKIKQTNLRNTTSQNSTSQFNLIEVGLFILGGLIFLVLAKTNKRLFVPVAGALVLVSFVGFKSGNIGKRATTTSPTFMDSAFSYYKPTINTRWDNTYFYVESKGIADHEMMIGITSWQQQVVDFAVSKGLSTSFTNYDTAATRGFVFGVGAKAIGAQDTSSENDLLGSLLAMPFVLDRTKQFSELLITIQ
jgi:hypothetical protein